MTLQEYVSLQIPFKEFTKEEILTHFKDYKFIDQDGHPLENCVDFINLIDLLLE